MWVPPSVQSPRPALRTVMSPASVPVNAWTDSFVIVTTPAPSMANVPSPARRERKGVAPSASVSVAPFATVTSAPALSASARENASEPPPATTCARFGLAPSSVNDPRSYFASVRAAHPLLNVHDRASTKPTSMLLPSFASPIVSAPDETMPFAAMSADGRAALVAAAKTAMFVPPFAAFQGVPSRGLPAGSFQFVASSPHAPLAPPAQTLTAESAAPRSRTCRPFNWTQTLGDEV